MSFYRLVVILQNFAVSEMSIKVSKKVWDGFPYGGTDYLTLLALADWSDDNGCCFPSIASIAKKIRLKHRQAQRSVHNLIDNGYVRVLANPHGGAPGSTRRYQIIFSALTGVIQDRGVHDDTGVLEDLDGCHISLLTGVTYDTLTVIEPSLTVNAQFAQFWSVYPKKKSQGDAERAFKAIKPDMQTFDRILQAIGTQKQSPEWRKENGKYIPYPATWLRAKSWLDEVESKSEGSSLMDGVT